MNYSEEELTEALRRNPDLKVATNSPVNSERELSKTEPKVPGIRKPSKYHNQRTEYNGRIYDTKGEAFKAQELDLRVKTGELDFWLYHVRFPLPGGVIYESDFTTFASVFPGEDDSGEPFWERDKALWDIEVIECKMWRKATKKHKEGFFFTDNARTKMKLFKATYPNIKLTIEK